MKNIDQVLRSRELDLVRVRQEVEALRIVIRVLADNEATDPAPKTISAEVDKGHLSVIDLIVKRGRTL